MTLKNILIFTLVIIFVLFILLIAYHNVVPVTVDLKFIGIKEFSVPASAVMVASFLIGLLVSFVWGLITSAIQSIETMTTKKKMKLQNLLTFQYQEGLHNMLLGHYDEAEGIFKKILKEDPKDLKTLTAMGNVLRMQSKFHEAEEYHMKALLIDDEYLPALEGLYSDYSKKSKWILAKNTLEKILENKDANTLKYKKEMVKIHIAVESWEDAIEVQEEVIKKATKSDKKDQQYLLTCLEYQNAVKLLESDKPKEAEILLKKIKEKSKNFAPAYIKLAETLIKTEDYANAFKILSDGYKATGEPIFIQKIEDLYIETNQPDDAINFFKNLTKNKPQDVLPIFTLGKLYYKFEMLDNATSIFDQLLAEVDYSPTLEYYVAKTEAKEGNKENSISRMKKIVRKSKILDITYKCGHCGTHSDNWIDRCPACGCWNCLELTPKNELNELEIKSITEPRTDY